MNRYRVLLPILVNGEHGQGDEFDHEFESSADEVANLNSGLLEIVPREYRVVGPSKVYDTETGDTFTAALTMDSEAALVAGGHIERVEPQPPAKPAATPRKKKGREE